MIDLNKTEKILAMSTAFFWLLWILTLVISLATCDKESTISKTETFQEYEPFTDESAGTGFINTPEIMANFEYFGFPVAGSDEMDDVYRINIYRYPDTEHPVQYRVDTFEEAVEFLEGLRG